MEFPEVREALVNNYTFQILSFIFFILLKFSHNESIEDDSLFFFMEDLIILFVLF